MKNLFAYFIGFLIIFSVKDLTAQKMISKGSVKMEITKVTYDDP